MATKKKAAAPAKKKLSVKKESVKDLSPKKGSSVKGGGTMTCDTLTWKKGCVV